MVRGVLDKLPGMKTDLVNAGNRDGKIEEVNAIAKRMEGHPPNGSK